MNNHPSTVPSTSSHTAVGLGRRHRARGATLQEDAVAFSSRLCGENAREKAGEGEEEEQEFGGLQALSGSVLRSSCSLASLLGEYLALAGRDLVEDHVADLDALHSRHIASLFPPSSDPTSALPMSPEGVFASPSLSATCSPLSASSANTMSPPSSSSKRKREDPRWFAGNGVLRIPEGGWSDRTTHVAPSLPSDHDKSGTGTALSALASDGAHTRAPTIKASAVSPFTAPSASHGADLPPPKKKRRKGQGCRTTRGQRSNTNRGVRAVARGQVLEASAFSMLTDATVSNTGWQGGRPPLEARKDLDALWHDRARLKSVLTQLFPAPYVKHEDLTKEQCTFFVDREGAIFMFRTYRASWLMKRRGEVEEACRVLIGDDLKDEAVQAAFKGQTRGDHLAIIIGYHRQCVKEPILSKWHRDHLDRVEAFLVLPIVQRIINWVSKMVELAFPGVAKRFREDAKLHEERYGIRPQFGLFWNYCINAWFPGQSGVHCRPHADWRNQIGVCALLVYVTESGANFDDEKKTWLVLWEVGVAVQMPPWVLALYPSSLLYHFNVDVNDIEFVTTAGEILWPTKENSRPLADGGDSGRGSMVFFNQGTMRHMPATGYDSLKLAPPELRTTDYGASAQVAFEKHVTFTSVNPCA